MKTKTKILASRNTEASQFDRAVHCRQIASRGGRALVEQRGREYMSQIGRRGFEVTTERYFRSEGEHKAWIVQAGLYTYWHSTGLPMKYTLSGYPLWPTEMPPHPAHDSYMEF